MPRAPGKPPWKSVKRRCPYHEDVPEKYRNLDRWFLLDTSLDSPRPWNAKTNIPVFSMALARGSRQRRRWLVYAHSPLKSRRDVETTIPEFAPITVEVPRAGAFYLINASTKTVKPLPTKPGG